MEHLPPINLRVETLRLAFGSVVRLCLRTLVYYGGYVLFGRSVLSKKGFCATWGQHSLSYVVSLGTEIGVSTLICPVRYLAAVTTPRFILDYALTGWSDVLRVLDRFPPGNFAAYALYAFSSDEDWSFDFFTWQLPSVALSLAKLWRRRQTLGGERCRTKRVLAVLLLQVLLRAHLATFSVMIPESGGDVVAAVVSAVLGSLATSYLARHTWPFADLTGPAQVKNEETT